ncbi:DUF1292 domain-containing protein [Paenibacillus thermotolerans]|uniref:DUF1292 domain-containing protein n=1 Tax=Paenibacillus thermotolerans TaxID=3027807 RepID=UPI002367846E|nr:MULTISPECIES: DUF1292 domain-containing protein [unclassified Paenibacillus]
MADHERDNLEDEEEAVLIVTDENGAERELVHIRTFDYDGNDYAVLIDRNDPDADGHILRIEQDGDELVLANIEDDEEWEAVLDIYNSMLDEEIGEDD